FRSVNCFRRSHQIILLACFYFDEDEFVAIATNDIDFSAMPSPEIAVKNFVALAPEKTARQFLSARAELQMVRAGLAVRARLAYFARHDKKSSARSGCATGSKDRR